MDNLTLYIPCIMFQCVDKPTRCNTSCEWSLLSIIWLYMFRTITNPSPGASSHKLYDELVCSCYQAGLTVVWMYIVQASLAVVWMYIHATASYHTMFHNKYRTYLCASDEVSQCWIFRSVILLLNTDCQGIFTPPTECKGAWAWWLRHYATSP